MLYFPFALNYVALRKESVDRNKLDLPLQVCGPESLSARRAWIEMPTLCWMPKTVTVALRKESVDRNLAGCHLVDLGQVALRKESVDRNGLRGAVVGGCLVSLSARRAWIEIVAGN